MMNKIVKKAKQTFVIQNNDQNKAKETFLVLNNKLNIKSRQTNVYNQ